MIELLTLDSFTEAERTHEAAGFCKWFQRIQMRALCRKYHHMENFCEIGSHNYFDPLNEYRGHKYIIDPYFDAAGAGLGAVPGNLPYPVTLFRCLLGPNSSGIPSGLIDFCFSVSVIEHIGQAEVHHDCQPTDRPPDAQEEPRNAFCQELFRIMRPGGITIHSVDHAPRNRGYVGNFLNAGFKLLHNDPVPSLDVLLDHPNAVRQRHAWLDPAAPMSPEEQRLHSVLTLGFRKPTD